MVTFLQKEAILGKLDDEMYYYFKDRKHFADLVNAGCFGGEQVVTEETLEELPGRMQSEKKGRAGVPALHNRYRDIRMKMKDGPWFCVLSSENQGRIDYELPWRFMKYDSSEYEEQIKAIHERKGDGWNGKMDQNDKLIPSFTICFYHGTGRWTGPNSLKDMMDFGVADDKWVKLFADYPIIVINAEDEEVANRCKTDLRQLLLALGARAEKEKMKSLFKQEDFNHLSYATARAITVMTDMPEYLKMIEERRQQGEEEFTMCLATDMIREEGREEGREDTIINNLKSVIKNLHVTLEQAMNVLDVPAEKREIYRNKFQTQ